MPVSETRRMIAAAVAAAETRKAEDLRVLELDPVDSGFTDFFLIASASNQRQSQAIAEEIERQLKLNFHTSPNSVEGLRGGEWILMDYVDFIVHVFLKEKRDYYDIERLRKSAKIVDPKQWKPRRRKAAPKSAKSSGAAKSRTRRRPAGAEKTPQVKSPARRRKTASSKQNRTKRRQEPA